MKRQIVSALVIATVLISIMLVSADLTTHKDNILTKDRTGTLTKDYKILNECGEITEPGYYILQDDISSEKSCLEIKSDNVVLDCQDNKIIYATENSGFGVSSKDNDRLIIKNCVVEQAKDDTANTNYASKAKALELTNSEKSFIQNNELTTRGDYSVALVLSNVKDSKIEDNKIRALAKDLSGETAQPDFKLSKNINIVEDSYSDAIVFIERIDATNNPVSHNNLMKDNTIEAVGNGVSFIINGEERATTIKGSFQKAAEQAKNILSENEFEDIGGFDLFFEEGVTAEVELENQEIRRYKLPGNGISLKMMNQNGEINFLEKIKGTGTSLSNSITLTNNFAEVNNNALSDVPAIITFNNLPQFANPVILRNGEVCSSQICTLMGEFEETTKFRVKSWSNYEIGEDPTIGTNTGGNGGNNNNNGGGSGGCTTEWTCTEWSSCNANGEQVRTCTKIRPSCFASLTTQPAEVQACTAQPSIEPLGNDNVDEDNTSLFSRITGAVIGPNGELRSGSLVVIFLVVLGAGAITTYHVRKRKAKK